MGLLLIGPKTIKKRMVRQLQAIKTELRRRMHDPVAKTGAWVERMLKRHLNYYAVSGNDPSLWWFVAEVRWRWLKTLKRRSRSQRCREQPVRAQGRLRHGRETKK
jgi:RNA-directed DNA polymerase